MSSWVKKLCWQGCAFALVAEGLRLPWGASLALVICAAQVAIAYGCHRHWRALAVQVRLVFLLLFVAGSSTPALAWLHALQLVGVNALLIADYCLLARLLTLLPWNRRVPLTPALVRAVLTLPPGPGSLAERLNMDPAARR